MKSQEPLKRSLAYSLVASVLVGAVIGILAILRNEWTAFEVRVLLTTAVLAAASLCGLACDLSRTPRGLNLIPYAGLVLTLVAATLSLTLVWWEPVSRGEWWEMLAKAAGCTAVFAIATAHISLLSVARLSLRFRWTLLVAYSIIYGLASLLATVILAEVSPSFELVRTIAVMSILDVAISLVIPLLHRISQTDPNFAQLSLQQEQNAAAVDAEIDKLQRRLERLHTLRKGLILRDPLQNAA